ncbi:hypothetical protein P3T43_001694 [Paraburkholderia sp. GAS41]|uniref:hypothetical protein n=1 Tax=Paraburkholderia sp. GAS41 TaxID=3035134 RepID=UPI003D24DAD1
MMERESGTANTVATGEAKAGAPRASNGPTPSRQSYRTLWVVVLTLPVTIVALAIALELFGLLLRLGLH